MQDGKVLSQADVKKILAEYFKIPEKNVIQSKYSYMIILEEKKDECNKES